MDVFERNEGSHRIAKMTNIGLFSVQGLSPECPAEGSDHKTPIYHGGIMQRGNHSILMPSSWRNPTENAGHYPLERKRSQKPFYDSFFHLSVSLLRYITTTPNRPQDPLEFPDTRSQRTKKRDQKMVKPPLSRFP